MILGVMDSIFLLRLGFVKSGSHLECLHATVGETIEMYEYQKGLFSFMAVLLSEAQTEIPVKSVNHTNLTFCHRLRSYFEGAIMLRILCAWEENNHIQIMPPVLFLAKAACCQSLGLMLNQRDLSLGALPALCCAPVVEEVLVYCLHDLVKYVYMNDDQLV